MPGKEVTQDEIASLPPFAQLSFVAFCVRFVWDQLPATQRQQMPKAFEAGLRIAEQPEEADVARRAFEKRRKSHPLTEGENERNATIQQLRAYPGARGLLQSSVATAIYYAVLAACKEESAQKKMQQETGGEAKEKERPPELKLPSSNVAEAYEEVVSIVKRLSNESPQLPKLFRETTRQRLDALSSEYQP